MVSLIVDDRSPESNSTRHSNRLRSYRNRVHHPWPYQTDAIDATAVYLWPTRSNSHLYLSLAVRSRGDPMATAPATHARSHRFRAPPPSPIATGKGLRSAAVDDLVLTEYLEDSLRVPDLNLPESYFPSRSPLKALAEVDLHSLVSGDGLAVRQVLAAAAEIGAVRVAGGGAPLAEEARAAIEACGVVFETPEGEKSKGALGQQCFGWRDALAEEFYWYRSRSPEMEQLLQRTWPDSYRTLRYVTIKAI